MNWFGRQKNDAAKSPAAGVSDNNQIPPALRVDEVFSTTVIAPLSYIDRSVASTNPVTRQKVRVLKVALEQQGKQVGIYGESKSGKTMFAIKTVREAGHGFIVAEGPQITSVDSFWRHVAEKLRVGVERHITHLHEKEGRDALAGNTELQFAIAGSGLKAGFSVSTEVRALRQLEVQTEVVSSVRAACLSFLAAAKMCVIVDDFHQIRDPKVRFDIITDTKIPSTHGEGKYVFISIPEDALFVGQRDEQLIGRGGLFEFPLWDEHDLRAIVRNGFAKLAMGLEEKQIVYVERNSFFNPLNVQQICIYICDGSGIKTALDVPRGFQVSPEKLKQALSDFAFGLNFFQRMLTDAAQAGGPDAAQRKFRVMGVDLNIYELVFLALGSPGATGEFGILLGNLRDKIKRYLGGKEPGSHLGAVVKRLADTQVRFDYENSGGRLGKPPLIYDEEKKKLFVANPMLRVYLLWGYAPEMGIDPDKLRKLTAEG